MSLSTSRVCKRSSTPPKSTTSADDALAQCPQAIAGTESCQEVMDAKPTDSVKFGRATTGPNQGSCACKFCEGIETACQPDGAVTGAATDNGTPTCFLIDEDGQGGMAGLECGFEEDRDGRHMSVEADIHDAIETCFRPEDRKTHEKVVFLLGDSHAQNLVPALTSATHGKAQLRTLTAPGIGFCDSERDTLTETAQGSFWGANFEGAIQKYRSAVLEELSRSVQSGDIVVIHNFYDHFGSSATCMDSGRAAAFYEQEIVVKIIEPKKATLMLFSDWTHVGCEYQKYNLLNGLESEWNEDPNTFLEHQPAPYKCVQDDVNAEERAEECFYHREWDACASEAKPMEHRQKGFQDLAERHPSSVRFHDLYGLFVDPNTDTISMNVPGTNVNWQLKENIESAKPRPYDGFSSHLNLVGALYLWPYVCQWLDSAWAAMEAGAKGTAVHHTPVPRTKPRAVHHHHKAGAVTQHKSDEH